MRMPFRVGYRCLRYSSNLAQAITHVQHPLAQPVYRNAIYLVLQATTWKVNTDTLHRMLVNKSMRTMRGRVYRPREAACIPPPPPRGEEPAPVLVPPSNDVRSVAPSFLAAKAKHATDITHPTVCVPEKIVVI